MKEILTGFFTWSWRQLKTWLDSNMKGTFTWFSTLRSLEKLAAEQHYGRNFDMNFLFMAPQIWIAEHYETYFDMILHFEAAQNFVAEHYGRDFDMIFHLKLDTAQNWVGQQHEMDFHMVFHFKKSQKFSCRALWRRFWHKFPIYGA